MAKYIIGDIHGHARTFEHLLHQISPTKTDSLYLLGDYIDRGPDTKSVLDIIMALKKEGQSIVCLKGNHEALYLQAAHDPSQRWQRLAGGQAMLDSFNCKNVSDIPKRYHQFIIDLEEHYIIDDTYILVHAGINGAQPDHFEPDVNLWIRHWYDTIDYTQLGNRYVLHGHTPITRAEVETMAALFEEKRVLNLDTGCYKDKHPKHNGYGWLTAFELDSRQLFFQANCD